MRIPDCGQALVRHLRAEKRHLPLDRSVFVRRIDQLMWHVEHDRVLFGGIKNSAPPVALYAVRPGWIGVLLYSFDEDQEPRVDGQNSITRALRRESPVGSLILDASIRTP